MIDNKLPGIMAQKGVSIRELSRTTGITYTTIRGVYHGDRRSVQLDVMNTICQALGVQPGDIYKYVPAESENLEKPSEGVPEQIEQDSSANQQARAMEPKKQIGGWKNW